MLSKKNLFPIILIITLVAIAADGFIYLTIKHYKNNEISNNLRGAARIIMAAIDFDEIEKFNYLEQTSESSLRKLRQQISQIQGQLRDNGIDSINIFSQNNNEIVFLLNVQSNNQYGVTDFKEPYLNPPQELINTISSQQANWTAPYSDEHGKFYSYFQPIKKNDQIIGVIATNISYSKHISDLNKQASSYFLIILAIYILSILTIYYRDKYSKSYQSLKREQKLTKELINSLPDIFYMINEDGKFILWNKAFAQKLGYSNRDMARINYLDLFKGKCRLRAEKCLKRSYQFGSDTTEARATTKNGERLFFEFFNSTLRDDKNKIIAIAGSGHDISYRKQKEEKLISQKNELEKINQLMVGRELKMIELKKEIQSLKTKKQ